MEDKSGYASINSAFSYIVQGRIIWLFFLHHTKIILHFLKDIYM